MGVSSQEGYRMRREGKDSALRKAETHGWKESLLENQLKRSKQRERRKQGEREVLEAKWGKRVSGLGDPWIWHMDVSGSGRVRGWSPAIWVTRTLVRNAHSRTYSKTTESETLRRKPQNLCFDKLSRWFWGHQSLGHTDQKQEKELSMRGREGWSREEFVFQN